MDTQERKIQSEEKSKLRREAIDKLDYKTGFEESYLEEIQTTLDQRNQNSLLEPNWDEEYAFRFHHTDYEEPQAPSYSYGANDADNFIKNRLTAQEHARIDHVEKEEKEIKGQGNSAPPMSGLIRKKIELESDYITGFVHGYNTQRDYPELALKEVNIYEKDHLDDVYRNGYAEGADYYLIEAEEKGIDITQNKSYAEMDIKVINDASTLSKRAIDASIIYSKEISVENYMPDYVNGHFNGMFKYNHGNREEANQTYAEVYDSTLNSWGDGYIDGFNFAKADEAYHNELRNSISQGQESNQQVDVQKIKAGLAKHMRTPERSKSIEKDQDKGIDI